MANKTLVVGMLFTALAVSSAGAQIGNNSWTSVALQVPSREAGQSPPVITSVSQQPGGDLIAIAGDDHIVNIFDRAASTFTNQLTAHTDWVRKVVFASDGTVLATAGNDRTLLIWDANNWDTPRRIARHEAAIIDMAFSSDGTQIITVGFEDGLRIYDVASGQLIRELKCECSDMRAVAFSPDDQLIAAGGRNGHIHVWQASTGTLIQDGQLHKSRIRDLQFADNERLITCGDDGMVKLSSPRNLTRSEAWPKHGGKLFAVCILDRDRMASAGSDDRIQVWNLEDKSLITTLTGHSGSVTCLDFDNNTLVSGSFDTQVRLWTAEKVATTGTGAFRR